MSSEMIVIHLFAIAGALCIGNFLGKSLAKFTISALNKHFENKDFIAHE